MAAGRRRVARGRRQVSRGQHAVRRTRTARALSWVAASLAAVLVITGVGGYLIYRHLSGNLAHSDGTPIGPRPGRCEALVRVPRGFIMFVGVAWLPEGAEVVPDDEHDAYAWWPADPAQWPADAHDDLRQMATLLAAA